MNNENQPVSNQIPEPPKNFWQRLKLWQKIFGITVISILFVSLYSVINFPRQQIENTDKLKQECCLECKNRTVELPIDIGPDAECGNFTTSSKCAEYFKNNPTTISECMDNIRQNATSSLITDDEGKVKAAFNTYLTAEENCDIDLANSVITEKSKEIMHYTCSNMADERKCFVNKAYKVLTKGDTAIVHFDDFSHKTGWPFFFAKENGEWKIDFYKMANGIAMGGSGCDTGWSWRNEEIKKDFCNYFKEGECPEEINTNQTSENIIISTDKLEYTPDEKILVTIKNNAKKEIKYSSCGSNYLPNLKLLGHKNDEWIQVPLLRQPLLCKAEEKILLSKQSVNIEHMPPSWGNENSLNFSSYKFSFGYTIENDENAFEKYGHFEVYSNEFKIE